MSGRIASVEALAEEVRDGSRIALPVDYGGVPMALTRAIAARGVQDLDLVGVPISGLQADMLIGAGCARSVETSAVTLGEFGSAPAFTRAVKEGRIRLKDATCPAIYAGLQAAEKGIPFMPIRGILESDILANRPDWKVIDNPFAEGDGGDPIVLIPAIRPDIATIHAPLADRDGNVWIGRRRELMTMTHAARRTLATVERVVDGNLFENEELSAGVIPNLYIDQVAEVAMGSWPLNLWDRYPIDEAAMRAYIELAQTGSAADIRRFAAEAVPPKLYSAAAE
ncbi:CoA transferase subunit A [Marinibaculum pumilum]|uniref:CoA transferase subunit A n=1 Tax=Marinibaculum pumilum TaxID=1766165 RepID=A0ABV7L905_9PROT